MAWRSSVMPGPGGYWLPRPARIASAAARAIPAGPSRSGKPWPRLIEPVATARADISAKTVVPRPSRRRLRKGLLTLPILPCSASRGDDPPDPPLLGGPIPPDPLGGTARPPNPPWGWLGLGYASR